MNIAGKLKNICKNLGENNKPTYVVMAIAAVKGICRPIFTMMDKKEEPKTKKYTAIREGLTEIIAIPVYWACGELSANVATKFLPKELQKQGAKNCMFIGVCAAALFIIPGLCSAAIKPIMDKFYNNEKGQLAKKFDITSPSQKIPLKNNYKENSNVIKRPNFNAFSSRSDYGIRVGGV